MSNVQYLIWILGTETVGALSALLSRDGIAGYISSAVKPALTPPAIVFPVVWGILYGLMGVSGARMYAAEDSGPRSRGLNLFVIQLVLNFFWTLIFFNLGSYGFALLWLIIMWLAVFFMILSFRHVDKPAALLQLPYLIWLSFAAILNYGVWQRN